MMAPYPFPKKNKNSPIVSLLASSRFLGVLLALGVTSFLDFGDDLELLVEEITAKEINDVSKRTGITFPEGMKSIGYYFLGSGIDRSIVLKVLIPADHREEFLKNEIFEKGEDARSTHPLAKRQFWGNVDVLTERIDRKLELPQAKFVECTLGRENGQLHVYVSWFEI